MCKPRSPPVLDTSLPFMQTLTGFDVVSHPSHLVQVWSLFSAFFFMLSVTPQSYCVRHKGGITLRRRSRATWYQKERISNCDHCFTLSCLRLLGSKHRTTGQRVITKLEPVRRIMPSFYGFQLLLADYWFLNWGRCDSVIIEMDYEMVFFFHYSCSSAFR